MAADWAKIKLEYITTDISCRKLAEKHRVSESTLFKKCSREQWEALRRQHGCDVEAAILSEEASKVATRASKLADTADMLLDKIATGIASAPIVTPTAAKNYSDALKNLKDIHMIRSDEDIEEQRVRIEKLRREADREDRSASITVTLEGEMASYGE